MSWLLPYVPSLLALVVFVGSFGVLQWRRRVLARRLVRELHEEHARLFPPRRAGPDPDTWDDDAETIVSRPSHLLASPPIRD